MSVSERTPLVRLTPSVPRSRWKTQLACGAVLLTETMERIAFYGAVGNLVVFLNSDPFNWLPFAASNALFIFTGVSYVTSLFGGWLADAILGRFKTIILFLMVYIVGYCILPALAYPPSMYNRNTNLPGWCNVSHHNQSDPLTPTTPKPTDAPAVLPCQWQIYVGLTVIAIGNGVVKANIAPFGADQVKAQGPVMMRRFFNYFYFCINIGAFIALGGLAYLQQEITWFWGYVAPLGCLLLSLLIFLIASCHYIRQPAGGSILSNIVRVICNACRGCCCHRNNTASPTNSGDETRLTEAPSCIDRAKLQYGGNFHDSMVEDVKILLKICLVFLALIPYWLVYFQIPAAWLSLFDVIALIFLIPIMDRFVYPALDRHGFNLSLRVRIAIGMVFSIFAMSAAGILEYYRLQVVHNGGRFIQVIGDTVYHAANMSVFYQIPQYMLIGIGEVFTSIAGLELAYSEAPRSLQTLIMGLFWFSQGLGSVAGSGFMSCMKGVWFFTWDNGDINCTNQPCKYGRGRCDCHLDYYFFTLAGVQAIGLALFIVIAWWVNIGSATRNRRAGSRLTSSMNGSRTNSITQSGEVSPTHGSNIQHRIRSREDSVPEEIT